MYIYTHLKPNEALGVYVIARGVHLSYPHARQITKHLYIHTFTYEHTQTHKHTDAHSLTQSHTHTHTHTHIHTHTHTVTHTHSRARAHTHTHTHTHRHRHLSELVDESKVLILACADQISVKRDLL